MSRLAALLGIVGGAAWVSLAVVPRECVPVTEASEVFCNRLWTAPLAAMFVASLLCFGAIRPALGAGGGLGLVLIVIGYGLMAGGNGGEYWVAYGLPHQGPTGATRAILWMAVLAGWLAVLVGSSAVGASLLRARTAPVWIAGTLLVAIPLTVVLGVLSYPALAVGVVGIAIGMTGLAQRADTAARLPEAPAEA